MLAQPTSLNVNIMSSMQISPAFSKYHMSLICGVLKNDTNEHFLQNRNGLADIENKLMVTRGA